MNNMNNEVLKSESNICKPKTLPPTLNRDNCMLMDNFQTVLRALLSSVCKMYVSSYRILKIVKIALNLYRHLKPGCVECYNLCA